MEDSKSIIEMIKDQMESGKTSPPAFSKNALKLQNEATAVDPDMDRVKEMIEMDQTMTGELLKMANSPYYKGLNNVETVQEALLRLGINEVCNLVMCVIHKSNFRSEDSLIKKYQQHLWEHSVACAIGSQWTANHLSFDQIIHKSFIAGLLHDMGKLFLISAIEDIRKEKGEEFNPSHSVVEEIMEDLHTTQGYELFVKWNLPEDYCIVARDHHALEFDNGNTLLALVRLVNRTCLKMGIGSRKDEYAATAGSLEAELLGMSEIAIAELEIKLEDSMLSME
jgi:HD-like signal output (HDOD) protein